MSRQEIILKELQAIREERLSQPKRTRTKQEIKDYKKLYDLEHKKPSIKKIKPVLSLEEIACKKAVMKAYKHQYYLNHK